MDGDAFDSLVRHSLGGASRRGVMRGAIGLLAALGLRGPGLNDLTNEVEAKNRRRRRRRRRKNKHKNPRPSPIPPPPPPPCGRNRILCPTGICCPLHRPQCCPAIPQDPFGACVEAGGTCCTTEQGGGTCPPWLPQCCAPTRWDLQGLCVPEADTCCTDEQGGDSCPPMFPKCCPPTTPLFPRGVCCAETSDCCPSGLANDQNVGCCPDGVGCCKVDMDCGNPDDFNCVNGCCVAEGAPLRAEAKVSGGARQLGGTPHSFGSGE